MARVNTHLRLVRDVFKSFQATSGLEPRLLNELQITAGDNGWVKFGLKIEQQHTNRLKILHGGTVAAMADLGGSLAVASKGLHSTGVTTDLHVTYLRSGGKVDDQITAEAVCDKIGRTLAFTTITFRNAKEEVFARASHTKHIEAAWSDPKNITTRGGKEASSSTKSANSDPTTEASGSTAG